jgi:hypothetical protein
VPRLSIIIPWLDDTTAFEDTLVSVLQNRPERCEILVVHPPEYEDPYGLDDEVRFLVSPAVREIDRINEGIEAASGAIVHVLRCGLEAVEGWVEPALHLFEDEQVALVAPLIVQRGDRSRVAAAGVVYQAGGSRRLCGVGKRVSRVDRSVSQVIAPTLSAGFYRRELLAAWGGFDPSVGQQRADVDLGLTLQVLDYRCAVAIESLVVGDVEQSGEEGFQTGRESERLYWRHVGESAGPLQLVRHAMTVACACLRQIPSLRAVTHLTGRLVGCCERSLHHKFRRRLENFASPQLFPLRSSAAKEAESQPLRRAA